jgi:hypothetical protein
LRQRIKEATCLNGAATYSSSGTSFVFQSVLSLMPVLDEKKIFSTEQQELIKTLYPERGPQIAEELNYRLLSVKFSLERPGPSKKQTREFWEEIRAASKLLRTKLIDDSNGNQFDLRTLARRNLNPDVTRFVSDLESFEGDMNNKLQKLGSLKRRSRGENDSVRLIALQCLETFADFDLPIHVVDKNTSNNNRDSDLVQIVRLCCDVLRIQQPRDIGSLIRGIIELIG